MKSFGLVLSLVAVLGLSGCAALKQQFGAVGEIFGIAQNVIETKLAAEVGGVYTVEISKDGESLLTESWDCQVGEDGKLAGCHKQEK